MLKNLFRHSTQKGLWRHKEDGPLDSWFLILVIVLLTIGTVMMFSASYVYASYNRDDSFYFLKRQLVFAAVGIVLMLLVSKVKISFYKRFAIPIMIISIALLLLVLV